MKHYTDEQMEIIRSVRNSPGIIENTKDKSFEQYQFLENEGLIHCKFHDSIPGRPFCANITEKGKAYLATLDAEELNNSVKERSEKLRWWIPNIIAIYAALVATIALFR